MSEWITVCQQIIGGGDREFETAYTSNLERFPTRELAISHGFTLGRSDDFNVAELVDGKLASFWWMNRKFEEGVHDLNEIAEQLGIEAGSN
mgnify:CR=1 FL=1